MTRKRKGPRFRLVARPVAGVIFGLALAMAVCSGVGAVLDLAVPTDAQKEVGAPLAMLISAGIAALVSGGLWAAGEKTGDQVMRRREATLTVAMVWLGTGVFGAIPFMIDAGYSPVDAFFEAASGFTTTGATIVTNIEGRLSRPLLLWRSLIQWLGGMGIVVLFVAIFPNLGVGGKHMFRSEVPGATAEGLRPRIAETSLWLWRIYLGFTLLEIAVLIALGMDPFEAVCHALTTMSTGGFSTRDASVGAFDNPAIEMAIAVFMLVAGVNFGLYYAALRGKSLRVFARSFEFKVYCAIVVISIVALAVSTLGIHEDPLQTLRYAVFMVATLVTSTGYGTDDYMAYPAHAIGIVLLLMLIGGSSGSTAGGLKVERVTLSAKIAWAQIRKSFRPSVVHVVRMGKTAVHSSILNDVAAFVIVYFGCLAVGTVLIAALDGGNGVTMPTAFGAMLSCLSNMGPGPFYIDADNFARYSDPSKLVFSFAMILGRLEFFTLLSLFVIRDFWRR